MSAPRLPSRGGAAAAAAAASPGRFVSPIRSSSVLPTKGIGSPARYVASPRSRSPGRLGATYSSPMRTLSPSRTLSASRSKSPSRTLSTIRHSVAGSPSRSSSRAVISPARRRDATLAFGGASISNSAPGYVVTPFSLPPRQSRRSPQASSPQRSVSQISGKGADDEVAVLHPGDSARLGVRSGGPVDVNEQRLRVAALERWADEERQKLHEAEQRSSRPNAAGSTPHRALLSLSQPRTSPSGITPAGITADSIRESARQQNVVARRRLAEDRAMRREESSRNADAMLRIFQSPAERVQRALQAGDKMQHSPLRAARNYRHPQTYSELLDSTSQTGEQLNLEPATPMTPLRDRAPPPPTPTEEPVALQPQPQPRPEPEPQPAAGQRLESDESETDSDYSDSE